MLPACLVSPPDAPPDTYAASFVCSPTSSTHVFISWACSRAEPRGGTCHCTPSAGRTSTHFGAQGGSGGPQARSLSHISPPHPHHRSCNAKTAGQPRLQHSRGRARRAYSRRLARRWPRPAHSSLYMASRHVAFICCPPPQFPPALNRSCIGRSDRRAHCLYYGRCPLLAAAHSSCLGGK